MFLRLNVRHFASFAFVQLTFILAALYTEIHIVVENNTKRTWFLSNVFLFFNIAQILSILTLCATIYFMYLLTRHTILFLLYNCL